MKRLRFFNSTLPTLFTLKNIFQSVTGLKKIGMALSIIFMCLFFTESISQSPFTPGNIVVSRLGDSTVPLTGDAHPVYLDEYSPAGTFVRSILLPTAHSGSNNILTLNGISVDPGALTLSANKRFLAIAGYDAAPGTLASDFLNNFNVYKRTIGLINYNGEINTTTLLADANGFPTCALTSNGTDIWMASASNAIRYTTVGASTFTTITNETTFRRLDINNGQLYASSDADAIAKIGTGLPTSGPQSISLLNGISISGGYNQFVFADFDPSIPGNDVVYVAHQGSRALRKYSLVGTTWVSNGQIGVSADKYMGITGVISGTTITLYIVRNSGIFSSTGGGQLVTLTDATGYNPNPNTFTGTPTVLATAPTNTSFLGVAFAPTPPSVKVSAKAFLQGAYNTAGRHKDVTSIWAGILNADALSQPYNTAAFGNYAGTESVSAGFFTSNTTTDMVDWVLVELRDAGNPANLVARRAAFIREDGRIVDLDGTSDVTFSGVNSGNYHIVIRHRNHLDIRTATAQALNGSTATLYDFSTGLGQAYDNTAITANDQMKDLTGGVYGMWGGNVNGDINVKATGTPASNDYLVLVNTILGGNTATILSNVYNRGDLNLDGTVKATGTPASNDYLILVNTVLGGNTATIYTAHTN